MKTIAMVLALALLTGQGFAAEDEKAKLLGWVEGEMLAADLAEGVRVSVAVGLVDLNGDGVNEALIYAMGPGRCGTGGCNLWIYRQESGGYEELAMMTIANPPIGVLDTSTNGWRDLFVTAGGGGAEYGARRMRFDGETYPKNPTTKGEPIELSGVTVLIGEDDQGTVIEPVMVE